MSQSKIVYDNSLPFYSPTENHPLIPNQNTYYKQDKSITINSGDRNIIKYPDSSSFEILLPTDIVNVANVKLTNWMFPVDFNTFSYKKNNLQMEFTLLPVLYNSTEQQALYNPVGIVTTPALNPITKFYIDIVNNVIKNKFIITINEGVYTNKGLANEIQNKMNIAVNNAIIQYMKDDPPSKIHYIPYTFFNTIVNETENKFWFVNTLNSFIFNNDSPLYKVNNLMGDIFNPCSNERLYSSYSYYGLPAYLGFNNIPYYSIVSENQYDLTILDESYTSIPKPSFTQNYNSITNQPISVNFVKPFYKYTLLKDTYILLDIETLNGADETKPFSDNEYTKTTNQGNGSVNAFLGRIPLVSSTNSYASSNGGGDYQPVSNFNPPLERLRKFKISLRYHDGSLVNFGLNEWSFSLNVVSYIPSQNVKITNTPF